MPGNQVRVGVGVTGAKKASSDLDRLQDKINGLGKIGAKGLAIGAASAVAGIAVAQLTDVLSEAVDAAREDEVSIQKLATSLKANVANWDGHTEAIERTIAAQTDKGFSDDEQRDSLARIVVATKDVNEAFKVQAAAMDLARLKGISLDAATDALIKIEGGQFRALKALGIQLPKNATATQALAAVQKAAAGQAAAFAQTSEGKLLVSQIKVGEAMERLGYELLPIVNDGLVLVGEAAENLSAAWDVASGKAEATSHEVEQLAFAISLATKGIELETFAFRTLIGLWQTGIGVLSNVVDAVTFWDNAQGQAADGSTDAAEKVKGAAADIGVSFDGLEEDVTDWRDKYLSKTGDIIRRNNRMVDNFVDTTKGIIDGFFDPIETRANLHDTRMQILADLEKLRNSTSKEDHRQTSDDISASLHDEADALNDLGKDHKLTAKDVDRFTDDVTAYYKALGKKVPADVQRIIDRLRQLAKMPDITKNVTINTRSTTGRSGNPGHVGTPEGDPGTHKARGGPVKKGQPYWVGEEGPEPFIPDQNGTIIPHGQATGGGGATFHITVNAGAGSGLTAGSARQLAAELGPAIYADMQRKGLLPRTATGLR